MVILFHAYQNKNIVFLEKLKLRKPFFSFKKRFFLNSQESPQPRQES